jgi:hypothetical protein
VRCFVAGAAAAREVVIDRNKIARAGADRPGAPCASEGVSLYPRHPVAFVELLDDLHVRLQVLHALGDVPGKRRIRLDLLFDRVLEGLRVSRRVLLEAGKVLRGRLVTSRRA